MKKFLNEFKEFAARGNMIDLAVGVIIGSAFGKIVSSLVSDIAMPLIGLLIGDIKIKNITIGPVSFGNFILETVDFIIIAFVVFVFIKIISRLKKKEKNKEFSNQEKLLMEIRDLLKKQNT